MKKMNKNVKSGRSLRMVLIIAVVAVLVLLTFPAGSSAESSQPASGDVIFFGHYEQDNQNGNGLEPIRWIVLAVFNDKALVISESILDVKKYEDSGRDATWETCSLRTWLNEEFFNSAFSAEEKKVILTRTLNTEDNPEWDTDGGNNTVDKVFLLSMEDTLEEREYFSDDESRQASSTPYAEARGQQTGDWWLRSPGDDHGKAAYVNALGQVRAAGIYVDVEYVGVRPGLVIDLKLLPANSGAPKIVGTQATSSSDTLTLTIEPTQFDKTNSSWTGKGPYVENNKSIADKGAIYLHTYGIGSGKITYSFSISNPKVANDNKIVTVSARLSSNFPYFTAPANGFSDVTLLLNGDEFGTYRVVPDDGKGQVYTWQFVTDQLLYGSNSLCFLVKASSTYQNGICIYYDSVKSGVEDAAITVRVDPE